MILETEGKSSACNYAIESASQWAPGTRNIAIGVRLESFQCFFCYIRMYCASSSLVVPLFSFGPKRVGEDQSESSEDRLIPDGELRVS